MLAFESEPMGSRSTQVKLSGTVDASGNSARCFDRSFENAEKTAWRYGVYRADGSRLERNGGFPIKTQGGAYGYVGYWGLWIPDNVTVNDGDTVTRFSYDNGEAALGSYTLVRKDGRLKRLVLNATTLGDIQNVPFFFWVNQDFTDTANVQRTTGTNLEVKWNGAAFVITGTASNGPATPDPACATQTGCGAIPDSTLQSMRNIQGWSESLGGQLVVMTRDNTGSWAAPSATSAVNYRTETVLAPGSAEWPATLYCVNGCPLGGNPLVTALNDNTGATSPYQNITVAQWGGQGTMPQDSRWNWNPVPVANVLTYTPNPSTGLVEAGGNSVAWSSTTAPAHPQFGWGLQTGQLVDAAGLANIQCDANGNPFGTGYYCPNKVDGVATVYVWETGHSSWNKFSGLKSGNTWVNFDPPLPMSYSVPANLSGTFANASLILQYNGFGELHGIPGKCVDPGNNAEAPCNGPGTRWVSAFTIPEGGALTNGGVTYFVKPLEQEVRLSLAPGQCGGLNLPTIADQEMPGQPNWTDPRAAMGAMPTVTDAPRVIHGVVQY